jgi:hypothetical protein
MGKIFAGIE